MTILILLQNKHLTKFNKTIQKDSYNAGSKTMTQSSDFILDFKALLERYNATLKVKGSDILVTSLNDVLLELKCSDYIDADKLEI